MMYHRSALYPKGYLYNTVRNSSRTLTLPPMNHRPPPIRWRHVIAQGRYAVYGVAGAGPAAIFVHGWGSPRSYQSALSRLAHNGVNVYAPRLPRYSADQPSGSMNLWLSDCVSWLDSFLSGIGIDTPITLVGHSVGGAIAVKVAYERPDRVAQLVLVNSLGGATAQTPLPRNFHPSAVTAKAVDLTRELECLATRQLPVSLLWGRNDRVIPRSSYFSLRNALGGPPVFTVAGTHDWLIDDPHCFGYAMRTVLNASSGRFAR
ncbi:alpha/beta fold hydrolase [Rhodococcus jostii]|uniref:Alpha/beta hydrolase family protein n=2 Tax=Rhodococcus jostii TaxID=132919 RepID=A0A1H4IWV2_RHOJO|nr:Alpha/beta hydrolase family protein [Rhodococcus jostii]